MSSDTKRGHYVAVERPNMLQRLWHGITHRPVFPAMSNEGTFLGIGPIEGLIDLPAPVGPVEPGERDKAALFDAYCDARRRRRKGPSHFTQDMRENLISDIAQTFPALYLAEGVTPWQPLALIAWLNGHPHDEQARLAAAFVLMLWNPWTDWRGEGWEQARPFNAMAAIENFNQENRQAFAAWIGCPIWP